MQQKSSMAFNYKWCITLVLVLTVGIGWGYWQYTHQAKQYMFSGYIMGTTYHIKYWSTGLSKTKQTAIRSDVIYALKQVDQAMSTYKKDSELMRFNRWPTNTPFLASDALVYLINESLLLSKLSQGIYDITVGHLVNLWGFGPNQTMHQNTLSKIIPLKKQKTNQIPDMTDIEKAKTQVGYQYLVLDMKKKTITKSQPVLLDLSSIAKGYGVDQASETLMSHQIMTYLVEVGGEIRVKLDKKIRKNPWKITIASPHHKTESKILLHLSNHSIATAGNYHNFYEANGQQYSHEINPKTGQSEKNGIMSATVLADNATLSDAYSTLFMLLQPEKAITLAKSMTWPIYLLYQTADDKPIQQFMNTAFEKLSQVKG